MEQKKDVNSDRPNREFMKKIKFEDDPELLATGDTLFHEAVNYISRRIDPAISYVTYQMNRAGIRHPKAAALVYMDNDGIPTIGINYEKFVKMTMRARIGLIEHQIGHIMSGHLGLRLGFELKRHCETKYGPKLGKKLYALAIETIADMFVTNPGALKDEGLPHYDIRKLGLPMWDCTLNVTRRVEELTEKSDAEAGGSGDPDALNSLLDALAKKMTNSSEWTEGSNEPRGRPGTIGDIKDDGDSPDTPDGSAPPAPGDDLDMADETGGMDVKDMIFATNNVDSMLADDKMRNVLNDMPKEPIDKRRGYMNGDTGQFIDAVNEPPVVPWHQRLNHVISSGISMERRITKKRLNRRNPDFGFGRVHENVTVVCFVIDTSGSMGTVDLEHVDAELSSIAQNTENVVNVIHADAGVAKCEEYVRGKTLKQFWGRGGTSFEPALRYIADEMQPKPDLVVYFTDGYGGRLDDSCPILHPSVSELLWILTPSGMTEETFRSHITEQGSVIKVEEWK